MLPYLFVLLAIFVRFLPFMGPVEFPAPCLALHSAGGIAVVFRGPWFAASDVDSAGAAGSNRRGSYQVHLLVHVTWDQLVTWAWYAAILWLGTNLREKSGPVRVVGAALASSVSFFLISNFAAWAAWDMYPRTFHGVMMSYAAGLPFFRGTVESDLFFSVAMFGTPVFLHALSGWMHKSSGDHIAAA